MTVSCDGVGSNEYRQANWLWWWMDSFIDINQCVCVRARKRNGVCVVEADVFVTRSHTTDTQNERTTKQTHRHKNHAPTRTNEDRRPHSVLGVCTKHLHLRFSSFIQVDYFCTCNRMAKQTTVVSTYRVIFRTFQQTASSPGHNSLYTIRSTLVFILLLFFKLLLV